MDTGELTQFVDWIRNYSSQNGLYIPSSEEYLEAKFSIDKEIEKHQERKEQARREQLQKDREEKIKPLIKYPCPSNLWEMTEEMFDNFHRGAKAAYDEEVEAIRKAEEERQKREKEEAAERERQRKENERLKAEAAIKEKRNLELRPYVVFIRDYNKMVSLPQDEYQKELDDVKKAAEIQWEHDRKEREAIEKKAAEEKAKAEAKLKEEREARMKAEAAVAEIKRQEEEQARIEAEKAEAELKSADSDKILLVVSELYFVRTKKRDFKSASSKKIYSEISAKIEEMENMLSDYEKKIRK